MVSPLLPAPLALQKSVVARWRLALIATLSTVLAIVVLTWFFIPNEYFRIYFRHFRLPAYERSLGFRVGEVVIPGGGTALGITWVEPGGAFARLGFRAGDWFSRYPHGAEVGFYYDLAGASEEPREVRVINVSSGRWEDNRQIALKLAGDKAVIPEERE